MYALGARRLAWVALLGLTLVPATARAEFTSRDLTATLYSSKFGFNAAGVPVVSVALMEGQQSIRLSSLSGLRVRLGDVGGPEVLSEPNTQWTVSLERSKPAQVRYFVIVGKAPTGNFAYFRKLRDLWAKRGQKLKLFEVGSVFALKGKVLDNRKNLAGLAQGHETLVAAMARAKQIADRHQIDVSVHAELHRRASGILVLSNNKNRMRVRIRDVVWFVPKGQSPITVHDVEFGVGYRWHGREDRGYRGSVYVVVDRYGKLAAVNSVDAESLLKGIVPSEIFPNSPMAALKTQAIAARSELFAKIGVRHLADPYLTCSSQMCQVYSGLKKETARTTRAVELTRGLMLFHGNRLVDTVYSANAGGFTENNNAVWNTAPDPVLRGHFDYHPVDPRFANGITDANIRQWLLHPPKTWGGLASVNKRHYRWRRTYSQQKITALVNRRYKIGALKRITVISRGVSGRARLVNLVGLKGTVKVGTELRIRRLLGNLKSAMFIVETTGVTQGVPASFTLIGGGYGHGVGMCQTGAIAMAEAGRRCEQILTHYYRGSVLRKVY